MKIGTEIVFKPEVKLRWLTIACFEIRIGDFSIVIDPCIGASKHAPFDATVIEKADMILVSHGHWDHISDLKALYDRFKCPVLCGELTAGSIIRLIGCNPTFVYPMTPNLELDFGAAKVRALFGRHTDVNRDLNQQTEGMRRTPWVDTPEKEECAFWGHSEYRNYLITTPGGMKILFWGNSITPEQLSIVRELRPDVALLQYTKQKPEELAAMVNAGGIKVLIPHHMDLVKSEQEYEPTIRELERIISQQAPGCTVVDPEKLRWYSIGLGICGES